MKKETKEELFESTPVKKAVLTLIIPTILSSLVMILYNLADTYFVGLLNEPIENAAVTLAGPLLLAFNAVNNLFGVGSSSMMSRAMGEKNYKKVNYSSAFGFYCSLIGGILFSLVVLIFNKPLLVLLGAGEEVIEATAGYIKWTVIFGAAPSILNVVMAYLVRAEGSALHASVGTMSGCFLNIILDPIFILPFGFNMGAAGAGCATFISNCFACLYFFVFLYIKRNDTFVSISIKDFKLEKEIVSGVFLVGIPASIQNLLNVTGMTVLNNFMSAFGSNAIAAIGIASKTTMIPMYIGMGVSQGIMPLIGYNYSSKNVKRMKESLLFAVKISLGVMVFASVVYFVFAENIVMLFMNNHDVVKYGASFMKILCLAQPLLCMDFMAVGVFQACGMGKTSFVFALLRKIVLEIPALFVFNKLLPMYGLCYAQPFAELILSIAAIIVLIKLFKKLEIENKLK